MLIGLTPFRRVKILLLGLTVYRFSEVAILRLTMKIGGAGLKRNIVNLWLNLFEFRIQNSPIARLA